MKGKILEENYMQDFKEYLKEEEKSEAKLFSNQKLKKAIIFTLKFIKATKQIFTIYLFLRYIY